MTGMWIPDDVWDQAISEPPTGPIDFRAYGSDISEDGSEALAEITVVDGVEYLTTVVLLTQCSAHDRTDAGQPFRCDLTAGHDGHHEHDFDGIGLFTWPNL